MTIKPAMQEMIKGILNTKELVPQEKKEYIYFMNAHKGLTKSNRQLMKSQTSKHPILLLRTNKQTRKNQPEQLPTKSMVTANPSQHPEHK